MREIKFRGWNTKHKKRIYGDLFRSRGEWFITQDWIVENPLAEPEDRRIEPETVGQFTWLLDKNGKEIYEGDILNYCNKNKTLYIVRYGFYNRNSGYKNLAPQDIGASFYLEVVSKEVLCEELPIYSHNDCAFLYPVTPTFSDFEKYKKIWGLAVVGNIYENQELLNQ